jgi:hypothetical protein
MLSAASRGYSLTVGATNRHGAKPLKVQAGRMGIGFTSDDLVSGECVASEPLVSPKYGLSVQQMHVLGLTPEGMTKVQPVEEVRGDRVSRAVEENIGSVEERRAHFGFFLSFAG